MTIVVTHTTPADSSFSTEGAAAWNADHALSGVGTMAEQDANSVAITGGAIDGTTLGATTPAAATFTTLTATGQTSLGGAAGSEGLRVVPFASQTSRLEVTGGLNGGKVQAYVAGTGSTELWVSSLGTGAIRFQTNTGWTQLNVAHTASAVNYVQVTGAATGGSPVISMQGSDANIASVYRSKGTGAHIFQNSSGNWLLRVANPTGTLVNYPMASASVAGSPSGFQVEGSDTNIGLNLTTKGTGALSVNTGSGEQVRVTDATTSGKYTIFERDNSNNIQLIGAANTANFGLYSTGGGEIRFYTASGQLERQFNIARTASAVNYVQVTGAATAAYAQISAQGSDTNTGVLYLSKGTGEHRFATAASVTAIQFRVLHTNNPQNYCAVIGGNAGVAPQFQVLGTDTNIDLALTPKGTGLVRFGTYTATALTIAGYIEIKDSGGTVRRLAVVA